MKRGLFLGRWESPGRARATLLTKLEAQLNPERFARIHRSAIVNTERIKELQPWFRGDYVIVLHDNQKLTLSRTYRSRLNL